MIPIPVAMARVFITSISPVVSASATAATTPYRQLGLKPAMKVIATMTMVRATTTLYPFGRRKRQIKPVTLPMIVARSRSQPAKPSGQY